LVDNRIEFSFEDPLKHPQECGCFENPTLAIMTNFIYLKSIAQCHCEHS
jgi:hypothetical protein